MLPPASRTIVQAQASAAKNAAIDSKISSCCWVNPLALISRLGEVLFSGISEKRVDTVAAVATHPVINPSPQTMCPATKNSATSVSLKIAMPQMNVARATEYPRIGRKYLANGLYVWMIWRMIVAAVANSAMQIYPSKKTTGPAIIREESSPHR